MQIRCKPNFYVFGENALYRNLRVVDTLFHFFFAFAMLLQHDLLECEAWRATEHLKVGQTQTTVSTTHEDFQNMISRQHSVSC